MFLGTLDKVYIVDKTENNPAQINGHPTWGAEWSISSDQGRPMDVITNSFCAVSAQTWVSMTKDRLTVVCRVGRRCAGKRYMAERRREPSGDLGRAHGAKPNWRRAI